MNRPRCTPERCRGGRPGFALLLTLALVLLAGAALAGLARRSATSALEARGDAEELRRRWAVASCRATLLPRAASILSDAEAAERDGSIAQRRVECDLAGLRCLLVITDESAKVNVNRLLRDAGPAEASLAVARVVSGASAAGTGAAVRLRPRLTPLGPARVDLIGPAIQGFEQVFGTADPTDLLGDALAPAVGRSRSGDPAGTGWSAAITLWGDGRLNIRRASDAALRCWGDHVGGRGIGRGLVRARDDAPDAGVADLIRRVARSDKTLSDRLSAELTDSSSSFGLWVVARERQRSWYTFSTAEVRASADPARPGSSPEASAGRVGRRWDYQW